MLDRLLENWEKQGGKACGSPVGMETWSARCCSAGTIVLEHDVCALERLGVCVYTVGGMCSSVCLLLAPARRGCRLVPTADGRAVANFWHL